MNNKRNENRSGNVPVLFLHYVAITIRIILCDSALISADSGLVMTRGNWPKSHSTWFVAQREAGHLGRNEAGRGPIHGPYW